MLGRKLGEVEDRDEILKALQVELEQAATAYRAAASASAADRKAAATKLAKLAEEQINSLAMKVRFEVAVQIRGRGRSLPPHRQSPIAEGPGFERAPASAVPKAG